MTLRPRLPSRRPAPARPTTRRAIGAPVRRARTIRRASAGLDPLRAGAILAVLVSAAAMYGVAHSAAFTYVDAEIEGSTFTDDGAIRAALEDVRGTNLFGLITRPLEDRIRELPTVRSADVAVRLPDTLLVRVTEREPILIWRVGVRRYLVDREGEIFARLGEEPTPDSAGIPVIEDRRAASAGLSVGLALDPVDIDAATRLASLLPADVGSQAEGLFVFVSDASGFTVRTKPATWEAVFGFYTPTLRTPELIPGQVRLLRSLLIGREAQIDRVILASETDGTFTTHPPATPKATAAP